MHTMESLPKSARSPNASRDYKMVVVGHRAVGKSALVVRFLTNRFISEYLENSEMTCSGVVEIDGEKMQLRIQDTSENGIRVPTVDHHFRWADSVMLVYSVTDKMSYQRLRHAATRIKEMVTEQETMDDKIRSMVVVGNKGDLDHMRQVDMREGMKLAQELGCEFYEASASEGWSRHFSTGAEKQNNLDQPRRRNGVYEVPRPTALWGENGKPPNGRRKSDPPLIVNSIFGLKSSPANSPENDMNNNGAKNNLPRPPPPTVPQIFISPSDEARAPERNQSRGRKLIQKLSPRFTRKFSNAKQPNQQKTPNIRAGLAKMGPTASLAVSSFGQGKCNTLPLRGCPQRASSPSVGFGTLHSKPFLPRKMDTLKTDSTWTSSLSDSSSSSSSTESLVSSQENDSRPTFFLRPETPVSEVGVLTSSEDEVTAANGAVSKVSTALPIRRSRSVSRELCLEGQRSDRQCNSDSDSSKQRLSPGNGAEMGPSVPCVDRRAFSLSKGRLIPLSAPEILREKKFNASEPFKHLCREVRGTRRMRDRFTPSKLKLIRDGIRRKIKTSFASDQMPQNSINSHFKPSNFHVTAVSQ